MRVAIVLAFLSFGAVIEPVEADVRDEAREILQAAGIEGGLVVHAGCGDGRLTAKLQTGPQYIVHGLERDGDKVNEARRRILAKGVYGEVSIWHWQGRGLPYAENLVNLIVVSGETAIERQELMRVLAPGGVALMRQDGRWKKVVKARPDAIDEWTHFLHGADGNPVAQDTVVAPPKHYQWISEPLWMRSHESDSSIKAMVTAGGRLFYIVDDAPASLLGDHSVPDKWALAARDAFNGVLLWKVPIQDWGWRAWKPSWFTPRPGDIPLNIQKRLVAVGDRVYATLGYSAPVSELDAISGRVLRTFNATERTAEILHCGNELVLTVLQESGGAKVALLDVKTGKRVWTSDETYGGTTTDYYRFRAMHGSVEAAKVDPTLNTASDGKVVALLDGSDVVCLDFEKGGEKWRSRFPLAEADRNAGGIKAGQTVWTGTLIVNDGVVVHASPNKLAVFDADSGKLLWSQPKKYLGHLWYSWKDVFVIDGLVWTWSAQVDSGPLEGSNRRSSWPRSVNGYDLHSGELDREVSLGRIFKTHHHHRCYRNKATPRYILASRRGTEFVDLLEGKHTVHNWVRGICHLGMMPANGLQYVPPHPCVCYMDEKINGFNVLAPAVGDKARTGGLVGKPVLQKGPAYGPSSGEEASYEDWPCFRHDSSRSGAATTDAVGEPELLWKKKVGRKVVAPVVVGDCVYVPLKEEHHLVALDANTGKRIWAFGAGARIDSPPTYHRGRLLFGSADGSVYCVDAESGSLVWRLNAAADQRFMGAFGQLESVRPVHGSVLVMNGTAYFAAGRSSYLDGGIELFAVDAESGKLLERREFRGPEYNVDNISQNYQLPMGVRTDILQAHADSGLIRMRNVVLDGQLVEQEASKGGWIHAKNGFLDDSYFKRIPWTYGGGSDTWARLMVYDDSSAYGVRMFDSLQGLNPDVYFVPGREGYLLFATDRKSLKRRWSRRVSIRIRAMVAAENALLVAGPPDVVDANDPLGAFEGRKGGVLAAFDKADGELLWKRELSSPPVMDGMAVANGTLYLALYDGSVACFGR